MKNNPSSRLFQLQQKELIGDRYYELLILHSPSHYTVMYLLREAVYLKLLQTVYSFKIFTVQIKLHNQFRITGFTDLVHCLEFSITGKHYVLETISVSVFR
jgi:hypothetical protein